MAKKRDREGASMSWYVHQTWWTSYGPFVSEKRAKKFADEHFIGAIVDEDPGPMRRYFVCEGVK